MKLQASDLTLLIQCLGTSVMGYHILILMHALKLSNTIYTYSQATGP